jgi:hypothetical protein
MTIMNEADYTTISLEKLPLDENIDIGNIYTPDYFKQFGLVAYTSDTVDETEMVGGYFQPIENLTKPYQYFVYLAEPFTFTLPTFKKAENSTLAFQPPPPAVVPPPPTVEPAENTKSSFMFDFSKLKNMILKPEYQDKPPVIDPPVAVAEPVQLPPVLPTATTTIDPSLNTITQPDTPKIEETKPDSGITPTPESPKKSLLYMKIKHKDSSHPFQKKTVQEIIDFYKDKPRTIDMFQNHLTYVLVESVIKDIHIGLLYLLKTFGLMVKTINLQSCYHINQRYVYLDNTGFVIVGKDDMKNQETKLRQMMKECIQTLVGDSKIEHTYLYKEYMNK